MKLGSEGRALPATVVRDSQHHWGVVQPPESTSPPSSQDRCWPQHGRCPVCAQLGQCGEHQPAAPAIDPAIIDTLRELDGSGGMGLAKEVFATFLRTADADLARVEAAVGAGDAAALGRLAHALKSSCANVGARALAGRYRDLEKCGREVRVGDAQCLIAAARREHQRAVAQLRAQLREMLMDAL